MNRRNRVVALEQAGSATGTVLHLPRDDHDHAAEWRRLLATGQKIGVVLFRGLNAPAVESFHAAKPQ